MATAALVVEQGAREDVFGALKKSKIARLKRRLAARKLTAQGLEQELKDKTDALRYLGHRADEAELREALRARQAARKAFAEEQQHIADIMVALVELGEEVE